MHDYSANTLAAFSLVANLSGSASDAELWDAYVAPQVGKTWEETNDWVQNGLMGAIYKAYAADYTEQLNAIMAEDTSAYTGAQKRDYYNRFVQICLNLENQQDYQFNNIFEQILPLMAKQREVHSPLLLLRRQCGREAPARNQCDVLRYG